MALLFSSVGSFFAFLMFACLILQRKVETGKYKNLVYRFIRTVFCTQIRAHFRPKSAYWHFAAYRLHRKKNLAQFELFTRNLAL